MEAFSRSLKGRAVAWGITFLCALAALFVLLFVRMPHREGGTFGSGFIEGFRAGLAIFLCFLSGIRLTQSVHALRHAEYRRKLYVQHTDERRAFIRQKVGDSFRTVFSICIWLAAVVAGSFSHIVFFTLLAVLGASALLMAGLKLYYRAKY